MIFRPTKKLADKLHEDIVLSVPLSPNPYLDWSAALFRADRAQYILLMNTQSLYSVVMHGRGITDRRAFLEEALANMRDTMLEDGFFLFHTCIAPHVGTVTYSKTNSRSTTGSLNELVYHATAYLINKGLSIRETSYRLNEIPMTAIGYQHPRAAFQKVTM